MAVHFEPSEFAARNANVCNVLEESGLDGLLMFAQESMYHLTGYDTFGFCFFQCLYLGKDGKLALLTRLPDLRQAQHTSILDDIRVWTDEGGARPELQLRDMLENLGASGKADWHRIPLIWTDRGERQSGGRQRSMVSAGLKMHPMWSTRFASVKERCRTRLCAQGW